MVDIEKIKTSGELELYVLGLLDDARQQEIATLSAAHSELAEEIRQIESALKTYAEKQSFPASGYQKEKLMAAIDLEEEKRIEEERPVIVPIQKNRQESSWMKYAVAASFILLAASGVMMFRFLATIHRQDMQLASLQKKNDAFASNMVSLRDTLHAYAYDATLLKHDMRKVEMKGLDLAPASKAMVYWDDKNNLTFLEVNNLPMNPMGKQYQLWAIVDDKPVDLGVFDANDPNHLHPMKNISGNVQAFAVTLEKQGGNPSPTMDQMYVIGKA